MFGRSEQEIWEEFVREYRKLYSGWTKDDPFWESLEDYLHLGEQSFKLSPEDDLERYREPLLQAYREDLPIYLSTYDPQVGRVVQEIVLNRPDGFVTPREQALYEEVISDPVLFSMDLLASITERYFEYQSPVFERLGEDLYDLYSYYVASAISRDPVDLEKLRSAAERIRLSYPGIWKVLRNIVEDVLGVGDGSSDRTPT